MKYLEEGAKCRLFIIWVFAALAIGCSISMMVFSGILVNMEVIKQIEKEEDLDDFETIRKLVYYVLLIFSVFTLLIAGCSFIFRCC